MTSAESDFRIAEYFVVSGLSETSQPLKEDGQMSGNNTWMNADKKDPITDICIIDKTMEEQCPIGFTCVETTPNGFESNLNHGSLTSHNLMLCYKRGRNDPPIIDIGVYDEGLDVLKSDIELIQTTPAGRSANVNNASGMGSHPIFLTYRRAKESAPQNSLVVTDLCIILTNKGEKAPYAYLEINKNLNKGLLGSNVHLCYKKSVRQVDSIAFRADLLARYPAKDSGSFPLPDTVSLFCLPMGATIECWSDKTNHPLPCFSSFVLTTETSDKIFGTTVTFYESYPDSKLTQKQRHHLRLLRGDGRKSSTIRTIHTNKAICLLSRWPMFTVFKDFLMYLYRMTVSPHAHKIPVERYIAHFMHKLPFPSPQRPIIEYQISSMIKISITRPQMTPIPLSGASFVTLLENLGPDNTLNLLTLALTEHKIVIHSLRVSEITCVAEALITLLFPFKWTCIYIPLCPLEMCNVLEAPCPFIAGVDSRYFDLFVPPPDIVCVNLDTNSVTLMDEKNRLGWRMLPKKPTKYVRTKLQQYYKELKDQCRPEDVSLNSSFHDPDIMRVERHRRIDRGIQESFLKLMACMLRGYRKYLLPITERPKAGTTDPGSLFNIQEFVKSRERNSQRVFNLLVGCQLFSSFIETRSLASFESSDHSSSSRTSSLVFFDDCIDRLSSDHMLDSTRLIEADSTLKSEHTVIIIPPEEKSYDTGYVYTTFPQLQPRLFVLDDDDDEQLANASEQSRHQTKRISDASTHARRTLQEVRALQKISRLQSGNASMWARLLLGNAYGCWFACLPAFVHVSKHKDAALRCAHNVLFCMRDMGCLLPTDETFYRVLLHLCSVYDKPGLAKRVFLFTQRHGDGSQISALTYGLYNKAVLEGTWLDNARTGYALWEKLRNVWVATVRIRALHRRAQNNNETSSDLDSCSHGSVDSLPKTPTTTSASESGKTQQQAQNNNQQAPSNGKQQQQQSSENNHNNTKKPKEDNGSTGGQSDHGYNSMPKTLVRRTSDSAAEKQQQQQIEETGEVLIKPPQSLDVHPLTTSVNRVQAVDPLGGHKINSPNQADVSTVKKDLSVDLSSDCSTVKQSPSMGCSFGADHKFLSSLSDSDQLRYHELCSRRSSLVTPDQQRHFVPTNESFAISGGISPLIGQKSLIESTQTTVTTTASGEKSSIVEKKEDLMPHETSVKANRSNSGSIFSPPPAPKLDSTSLQPPNFSPPTHDDDIENELKGMTITHSTPMRNIPDGKRKNVNRQDISNLMSDPLSPLSGSQQVHQVHQGQRKETPLRRATSNSLKRNLVDEIENYMNRGDALVRCASDATISSKKQNKDDEQQQRGGGSTNKERKASVTSSSSLRQESRPNHFLSRSMTFGGGGDSSWLSSPNAKFINGLIKSTTMNIATKAKQAATNIAKDLNETMRDSIAYYTNESWQFYYLRQGQLIQRTESKTIIAFYHFCAMSQDFMERIRNSNPFEFAEQASVVGSFNDVRTADVSSSQTSLKSSDSSTSNLDNKNAADKVRRRGGHGRESTRSSRPCSMPAASPIGEDFLPPDNPSENPATNKRPDNRSANVPQSTKPSPSQTQCDVLVTISSCSKCSKCKGLVYDEEIMAGWTDDESNLNTRCFVCNFKFVPFLNIEIRDNREASTKNNKPSPKSSNPGESNSSDKKQTPLARKSLSSSTLGFVGELVELAFPYLSSLVLRKEIESLLENEGSSVLSSPSFVDEHPIIYWNLVWYFRRLNLYSNLYNLMLKSELLKRNATSSSTHEQISLGSGGAVSINLMWDNLKLQEDRDRDPIYCVWPQIAGKKETRKACQYPLSLIYSIKDSITHDDDVRSPLVALLTEFHVHRSELRRSAYREILFFIIVALGKTWIDVDAFDREYKRAYDALTITELDLFKSCDRLPTNHASACRRTFGSLDLYK